MTTSAVATPSMVSPAGIGFHSRRATRRRRGDALTAWTHVDTAAIPGEADPMRPMRLMRRDDEFSIVVGTTELMSNRQTGSERALGLMACRRLGDRPRPRVLIGGLGMGFTLRAALDVLGPSAEVVVAELVPAVVAWSRGPLAHLLSGALDDPRVEVRVEDVGRAIQSGPARYDAILLDVDNGPEGFTRRSNGGLYDAWGLKRARFALRPNGILAVWSGAPDRRFKARLKRCGFTVDEQRIHAEGRSGPRHVLWLATRPEGPW